MMSPLDIAPSKDSMLFHMVSTLFVPVKETYKSTIL